MSDSKIIQFRPKPEAKPRPSAGELAAYYDWTKNWDRNMRELVFPQYAKFDTRP